jgi:hypothetical protein
VPHSQTPCHKSVQRACFVAFTHFIWHISLPGYKQHLFRRSQGFRTKSCPARGVQLMCGDFCRLHAVTPPPDYSLDWNVSLKIKFFPPSFPPRRCLHLRAAPRTQPARQSVQLNVMLMSSVSVLSEPKHPPT